MEELAETADPPAEPGASETRALCVRVDRRDYLTIRSIAITQGLTNSQITAWAIDLLRRYVHAGGAR
jgi:hypothetical protein